VKNAFHTGGYYTMVWEKKRGKLFFCLRETQRLKRVLFSRSSLRPLWQVFLRQGKFFWGVKFCQKMYLTLLFLLFISPRHGFVAPVSFFNLLWCFLFQIILFGYNASSQLFFCGFAGSACYASASFGDFFAFIKRIRLFFL